MTDEREVDVGAGGAGLDIGKYLALAWHWAWLFVLTAGVAGAAGYFFSRRQTPLYASTTTIMINETQTAQAADYQSLILSERLALTYSKLLLHRPILKQVREELGLETMRKIRVETERSTQLVKITAEHTDPDTAADIANTLVRVFSDEMVKLNTSRFSSDKAGLQEQVAEMEALIEQTSEQIRTSRGETERTNLETQRTQYRQIYSSLLLSLEKIRIAEAQVSSNIVQVEPAEAEAQPASPQVRRSTVLAAFLGLFLSVGAVFGCEALDNTVKDPEDLSRRVGLPVLGVIVRHTTGPGEVIVSKEPRSPVAEAFRALRTNMRFAGVDRPLRCLMVTSPTPGEGKTTISANLAVVLAQSGKRVCLVDADLRRPMVHKMLRLPKGGGLSGLFVENEPNVGTAVVEGGVPGLRILPAGLQPPNPSELLGSNRMREILDMLLETSDMVILDTPPVMTVTDASILASQADGVILVFRPGSTKIAAMKKSVDQLRHVGAGLLGLVANDVNVSRGRYGYYYYREYSSKYNHYASAGGNKKKGLRRILPF